jgi:hypothetical protein
VCKGISNDLILLFDQVEYITMGGQTLNKAQTAGYLDMIYALGLDRLRPSEAIHTPNPHTGWTLAVSEYKDPSIFPESFGPFTPHFHSIKIDAEGKAVRIAQMFITLEQYKRGAKFFEFAASKAREAAQAGTGA